MLLALGLTRQAKVTQAKQGGALFRGQRDLDRGRARRHRRMPLPTPGHDEAAWRIDLAILTTGDVLAIDVDAVTAARARVECRPDPHPLGKTLAVRQVGEHDLWRRLDPLRHLDDAPQILDHRRPLLPFASSSASCFRRPRSATHIWRSTASSGPSARRSTR